MRHPLMVSGAGGAHPSAQGFSLIEIMVAVVIVGILSSIALPSYRDYVVRSALSDAMANLATKRVQNEQYFQDGHTYVGAPGCVSDSQSSPYFTFSCVTATQTAYTVQAVGQGLAQGFTFSIDQSNTKATPAVPAGWLTSTTCWTLRKGDAPC